MSRYARQLTAAQSAIDHAYPYNDRAEAWEEQDFGDFQTWQQSLPDAQLAELYFDFIESLKPGRTLRLGGVSTFEDWAYEHRWPLERAA